jgi:hypothetical protein
MKLFVTLAALAAVAGSASAAVTVSQWDLLGAPGDQAFTLGSAAANVTANNLTRGTGLLANTGGNSLNSAGWTQQSTDFVSFGFNVAPGFSVDLDTLYIGSRSSNTGPGSLGLFYSGDGFSTNLFTLTQVGTTNSNNAINLASLPNLTGNVEFRLVQLGNVAAGGGSTSAAGTFRVTAYFVAGQFDRNLQFTGTVIPAPASLALIGLAGLTAGRRRR